VGEVIPIVGMMMATIPAVLFAVLNGGVSYAFWILMFYILVTQFENHILAPLVVNKVVGIPSVICLYVALFVEILGKR
jgi:predicted PurR-regulated permease PerM